MERCLIFCRKSPLLSQRSTHKEHFAWTRYIPLPAVRQQNTQKTFLSFVRSLAHCLQLEIPWETFTLLYSSSCHKTAVTSKPLSQWSTASFLPSTVIAFSSSKTEYTAKKKGKRALKRASVPWKACWCAISSQKAWQAARGHRSGCGCTSVG